MPEIIRKLISPVNCILVISYILLSISRSNGQESYTPSNPDEFVPKIRQNNYELVSSKDKYQLWIDYPEGSSRVEKVELVSDENDTKVPKIEGFLNLVYKEAPYIVTVIYEADENGYRARYIYGQKPIEPANASLKFLQSAAG